MSRSEAPWNHKKQKAEKWKIKKNKEKWQHPQ